MRKEKKNEEQFHRGGERIVAAILKNIKDGKDDPRLGWPGCDKFFPPKYSQR